MNVPDGVIVISSIDGFNRLVNSYKDNLIVVDFYAEWCGPCKAFLPIYKKVQKLYHQKGAIFTRIDTDRFPEVSEQFGIKGVPSLILIRNKKGLKKHVGALGGRELMNLLDQYLQKN